VVSIAPILAVDPIRDAVAGGPAPVVGVSPIIGDSPIRGMADKCLATLGVEVSAAGVGALYGARRRQRSAGRLAGRHRRRRRRGFPASRRGRSRSGWTSEEATAQMVADALSLAGVA